MLCDIQGAETCRIGKSKAVTGAFNHHTMKT
jgi:hypothetical protein